MKLFPKYAPLAVENFLTHAKEGYYNGLLFHRVINNFMIQTGDPKGDGTGGESIWKGKDKSKDSGTGFENEYSPYLYNLRGALAMANSGPNTNGSQFYINQNKDDISSKLPTDRFPAKIIDAYKNGGNPTLDGGNYTVFGQVIDGMDVVDKIASAETDDKDKPKTDIKIEKIEILKELQFQEIMKKRTNAVLFLSLRQFIKVPDLIHPAFIEVWFVANHKDRAFIFFQSTFEFVLGIHIQVVGRLV